MAITLSAIARATLGSDLGGWGAGVSQKGVMVEAGGNPLVVVSLTGN